MSLTLANPQAVAADIVAFIENIFQKHAKQSGIIAVSGGIDSALSLTLLAQALPKSRIYPVLLPYQNQPMDDARTVCTWNQIPQENWQEINIEPIVASVAPLLELTEQDYRRLGNVMARTRMIILFDLAKKLDGLVVGTENKSEKYLGYFTRFGDEASDIEPLQHLYKTQVRQLAAYLGVPEAIQTKAPSAGLWADQTDEVELGFSYELADQVLEQYIDERREPDQIELPAGTDPLAIQQVISQVTAMHFKHEVPYKIRG